MAESVRKRMEVAEFLAFQGDRDTRYQLRDGVPVAMAPPSGAHGILAGNLAGHLSTALSAHPRCAVWLEAGIRSVSNKRSFHQADMVVTCTPVAVGQQQIDDPLLIVEVLSPSTADDDRRVKLPDYRAMPSVKEIVLIDSRYSYCEIHRRQDGDRWLVDLYRQPDARVRLDSVGLDRPLGELYANVPVEAA
ncbi:MAG: Uma2 family endonuclease [Pseudomonadota bacterium]